MRVNVAAARADEAFIRSGKAQQEGIV